MTSPTRWTWATPGDGEGQGSLACCSPWGHKESDTTEWPNKKKTINTLIYIKWGKKNYDKSVNFLVMSVKSFFLEKTGILKSRGKSNGKLHHWECREWRVRVGTTWDFMKEMGFEVDFEGSVIKEPWKSGHWGTDFLCSVRIHRQSWWSELWGKFCLWRISLDILH